MPLGAEVKAARFYYLDQLALVACGPSLLVYSIAGREGSSPRALTSCAQSADLPRYRLAHRWSNRAQQLTDVAAPNDFLSPVVLIAASDKTLTAYDLHAGRPTLVLHMGELSGGGHSRPVRTVRLSPDASESQLLLTSANDSTVRLWDLRVGRCAYSLVPFFSCLKILFTSLNLQPEDVRA
mmetsp:Transcript_9691/g.23270  ORF Transcript_9691/g.23270 Transcript_9691/m.23270 type:complete len:181 (+) Transcript_9691:123-665(+)